MKKSMKNVLWLAMFLLLAQNTMAGGTDAKKGGDDIYAQGATLLNIGIGVPWFAWTPGSGYWATPNITASLEFGVHKWISVGPYVVFNASGWTGDTYYNQAPTFTQKVTYSSVGFAAGAKGAFHFSAIGNEKWNWNINTSKLDLYAAAFLGAGFWNNTVFYEKDKRTDPNGGGFLPSYGISAGVRYFFSPKIGVYGEIGPSPLGWVNGGLTVKLK